MKYEDLEIEEELTLDEEMETEEFREMYNSIVFVPYQYHEGDHSRW
jgi:hypothetical protein